MAAAIDLSAIHVPHVFAWLAAQGGVARDEMLRTFNCGVGMIAVVSPEESEAVAEVLEREGETVTRIGVMTSSDGARVTYRGELDL